MPTGRPVSLATCPPIPTPSDKPTSLRNRDGHLRGRFSGIETHWHCRCRDTDDARRFWANRTRITCRCPSRRTLSYRTGRKVFSDQTEIMANRLNNVLGQIRKLSAVACAADAELLARFVEAREEIVFGTLMKRHGPMVLSVCQRVLAHAQDAEDACQATFLVLAQKAASIRKSASLSSWLHGVAFRVATNLRVERNRRRKREAAARDPAKTDKLLELRCRQEDPRAVLDEELMQLPESPRAAAFALFAGREEDTRRGRSRTSAGAL